MPLVSDGEYADGTDRQGQTDGLQTVTLRYALDAASIKINKVKPYTTDFVLGAAKCRARV